MIFFLDGLPATGKSTLAHQLATDYALPIWESDYLATSRQLTYDAAAVQVTQAAAVANTFSQSLIVDSFITEAWFDLKATLDNALLTVGLFCPEPQRVQRFAQRAGIPVSKIKYDYRRHYKSRYGNLDSATILQRNGRFCYRRQLPAVEYDLFFNTNVITPKQMVADIAQHLQTKSYQSICMRKLRLRHSPSL